MNKVTLCKKKYLSNFVTTEIEKLYVPSPMVNIYLASNKTCQVRTHERVFS